MTTLQLQAGHMYRLPDGTPVYVEDDALPGEVEGQPGRQIPGGFALWAISDNTRYLIDDGGAIYRAALVRTEAWQERGETRIAMLFAAPSLTDLTLADLQPTEGGQL
jgi:hypothetical protein